MDDIGFVMTPFGDVVIFLGSSTHRAQGGAEMGKKQLRSTWSASDTHRCVFHVFRFFTV